MLKRCASQYATGSETNVIRFKIDEDVTENPTPLMPEPMQDETISTISTISTINAINVINISSSSTYDGVYDGYSESRNVRNYQHDQIPEILQGISNGTIAGFQILNFDCCGGCIDCGHNTWSFQSEKNTEACFTLIRKGLELGWTIYISDFALKVFISQYNLYQDVTYGECPFILKGETRSGGHINMEFPTNREFDGPFEQLRRLTEPKENIGNAMIEVMGGTIRFEIDPVIISRNLEFYSVEIQAVESNTHSLVICELKYTRLPGKINCYGLHLSKLSHCNTTEERLFSCLRGGDVLELQTQLEMAGDNQELRMASIQNMASRTVSSY
jgi:hypothetical protein